MKNKLGFFLAFLLLCSLSPAKIKFTVMEEPHELYFLTDSSGVAGSYPLKEIYELVPELNNPETKCAIDQMLPQTKKWLEYEGKTYSNKDYDRDKLALDHEQFLRDYLILQNMGKIPFEKLSHDKNKKQIKFESPTDLSMLNDIKMEEPTYTIQDFDHQEFLKEFNKNHKLKAKWGITNLAKGQYGLALASDGNHYLLRRRKKEDKPKDTITPQKQHNEFRKKFKSEYPAGGNVESQGVYTVQQRDWKNKPWSKAAIQNELQDILRSLGVKDYAFSLANISIIKPTPKKLYYTIKISYQSKAIYTADNDDYKITIEDRGKKYKYNNKTNPIPPRVRKHTKNNIYTLEYDFVQTNN